MSRETAGDEVVGGIFAGAGNPHDDEDAEEGKSEFFHGKGIAGVNHEQGSSARR